MERKHKTKNKSEISAQIDKYDASSLENLPSCLFNIAQAIRLF